MDFKLRVNVVDFFLSGGNLLLVIVISFWDEVVWVIGVIMDI